MITSSIFRQKGNALIFVAALLGVMSTLVLGGLSTLESQKTEFSLKDQRRISEKAKELLIAYATTYGRLPCPSLTRGGGEDCSTGAQKGWLPMGSLSSTLGKFTTDDQALLSNSRYVVYRAGGSANLDLAALTDNFQPYYATSSSGVSTTVSQVIGLNDFCAKVGEFAQQPSSTISSSNAYVNSEGKVKNVPAAVAVGNSVNFSELNASNASGLEDPARPIDVKYRDIVIEIPSGDLSRVLQCKGILESMNSLQLGAKWIQKAKDRQVSDIAKWEKNIKDESWSLLWAALERTAGYINIAFKQGGKLGKSLGSIFDGIKKCLAGKVDSCAGIAPDFIYVYTAGGDGVTKLLKQIFSDANEFAAPVVKIAFYSFTKLFTELMKIWDSRLDFITLAEKLGAFSELRVPPASITIPVEVKDNLVCANCGDW